MAYGEMKAHVQKLEGEIKDVQESLKTLMNSSNIQAVYLGDVKQSLSQRVKDLEDKHQDLVDQDA